MATRTAPDLDFVTLANLHAALDSVLEIEGLLGKARPALPSVLSANRLGELAAEMRAILSSLLTPVRR